VSQKPSHKVWCFQGHHFVGAKLRAVIDENRFLEIYFDPTTKSKSYGLVDLKPPYTGDKRILGWDDYPHEGVKEIRELKSYPHHFQRRKDEEWTFEESPMDQGQYHPDNP